MKNNTPHLTVRGPSEEGYFYSKELNYLKNTGHTFDLVKTDELYYKVHYNGNN